MLHLHSTSPPGTARTDVIDAHVGARIRMRRVMLGLPLRQMAEVLGVSRQQLVKYERAKDRISASRLYLVASTLGVPMDYFFAGLPNERTSGCAIESSRTGVAEDLLPRDGRGHRTGQLIGSYWRITDRKKREQVLELVRALAGRAQQAERDGVILIGWTVDSYVNLARRGRV